jgi:hypothetical protein
MSQSGSFSMKPIVAAAVAALVFAAAVVRAQDETPEALHLSDIMAQQQMRHIKLWFAGNAGNWPLADYEVDALKDGFDDIGKLVGDDFVQQHVGGAISDLEKAVDAKNHNAFVVAFDTLSASCNACHHTLDHAFIVIQRPALLPFSDQDFSPQK